jgi:hypothetical protein
VEGRAAHPSRSFFERALAFTSRAIGRWQSFALEQNLEVTEQLTSTVDGVLAPPAHDGPALERSAGGRRTGGRRGARRAPPGARRRVCPEGFEAHFRRGADRYPRFLDLFAAYIGEQIKSNDRFRAIFTTGQLSRLDGLAMETAELVRGIDARFGSALARIESAIDSQSAMLAEILARSPPTRAFPRRRFAPCSSGWARGTCPAEDIANRLAAKAEEYLASGTVVQGRRYPSRPGRVRRDAFA